MVGAVLDGRSDIGTGKGKGNDTPVGAASLAAIAATGPVGAADSVALGAVFVALFEAGSTAGGGACPCDDFNTESRLMGAVGACVSGGGADSSTDTRGSEAEWSLEGAVSGCESVSVSGNSCTCVSSVHGIASPAPAPESGAAVGVAPAAWASWDGTGPVVWMGAAACCCAALDLFLLGLLSLGRGWGRDSGVQAPRTDD